jgi:hypothetical protein
MSTTEPDMSAEADKPERWLMVLIVDREDDLTSARTEGHLQVVARRTRFDEVARPSDWEWGALVHARVEVVEAQALTPGDSVRIEVDGDARWVELGEDGEVTW